MIITRSVSLHLGILVIKLSSDVYLMLFCSFINLDKFGSYKLRDLAVYCVEY
jgi:hypothetical protein